MPTPLSHPARDEYAPYYHTYVSAVLDGDLMQILSQQCDRLKTRLSGLADDRAMHRYDAGKWSVKEVVNHLSDAERVFSYRLLRIARGDETPLPGFDQEPYVATARSDARTMEDLLGELVAVRAATMALIRSLPEEAWGRRGTASGQPVSARALAAIMAGHVEHHLRVLGERYGV